MTDTINATRRKVVNQKRGLVGYLMVITGTNSVNSPDGSIVIDKNNLSSVNEASLNYAKSFLESKYGG